VIHSVNLNSQELPRHGFRHASSQIIDEELDFHDAIRHSEASVGALKKTSLLIPWWFCPDFCWSI